jgi:hypothetical protein
MKTKQLFRRVSVITMTVLGFIFLNGCPNPDQGPIVDFSSIRNYVGQDVGVEGCLEFVCPTVVGAKYPEDCLIALYDAAHEELLLEFDPTTAHFRDELDRQYPVSYPDCVQVYARGTVMERRGDDFYRLNVAELEAGSKAGR